MKRGKSRGWIEPIKTAMIVLLIAGAVLTGWRSKLLDEFFRSIPLFGEAEGAGSGEGEPKAAEPGGIPLKEAARPIAIVITNGEGGRHGVKYETDARNAVYNRTSSILGESLGSMSAQTEIGETEWREALSSVNMYYEYSAPVKLSILAGWFGARLPDTAADTQVRRVFVSAGGDRNRLYYQNCENGLLYAADTVSLSEKLSELGVYTPNGAQYAFETGVKAGENSPYTLILPGNEYTAVRASSPGSAEELMDIALDALGHGDETYTPYYNIESMLTRVGTQFNILADASGSVTYRRTDLPQENGGVSDISDGETVELARAIAAGTLGRITNGAEVFFEEIVNGEDGSRTVLFGYYIAGGRIYATGSGAAARITLIGTVITEAELNFRSYIAAGEYISLMYERQALASADGEFTLRYSDTGEEILRPSWEKMM